MYDNKLVEIPKDTGKITFNKRGNTTYVEYTYDRIYDPAKKYNRAKRTTIGKMSEENSDMMYPNPNFSKYFPDAQLIETVNESDASRSSCIRVGAFAVIEKIIEEYRLYDHFDEWDDYEKGMFLDLAAYSIVTESNVAQHYPEYAYNHPLMTPKNKIYSDSSISRFLSKISDDDRISFIQKWNEHRDHKERIYVSYDSTNKNCKAGDIEKAEYGHAKVDVGAPVFNYAIAFDTSNQVPLFYEDYPGSIVDVSQLRYMVDRIKSYNYRNIGIILDRGYFSKENIRYIEECKYDFVIMAKGHRSFVNSLVLEHKNTFEEKRSCAIKEYRTYGKTVSGKLYADDEKERYFHIYYKPGKSSGERIKIEDNLQRMESHMEKCKGKVVDLGAQYEAYYELTYHEKDGIRKFYGYKEREDVIERELKLCGYFVIVTSRKMTAEEALCLYKSRDVSEKLFCSDKSFLGNRSLRVSGNEAAESKIFIEFVALIIRSRMYTLLRKRMAEMAKKPNYMTVPAAIRELEKIELIRQADGHYRLDHAITATQKTILGAFGIDEETMKESITQIGKKLENAAAPEQEDDEDGSYEDY